MTKKMHLLDLLDINEKKRFYYLLFVILVFSLIEAVSLALIIPYLNVIQNPNQILKYEIVNKILDFFHIQKQAIYLILFSTFVLFFILTIKAILNIYVNYQTAKFPYDLFKTKTIKLHDNYMHLDYLDFISENSNTLIKNCTGTTQAVAIAYVTYLRFLVAIFTIVFLIALLLLKDFMISFLLLIVFFGLGIIFDKILKKNQKKAGELKEKSLSQFHKNISESFLAFKEIRLGNKYDYFGKKIKEAIIPFSQASMMQTYYPTLPLVLVEYIIFIFLLVIVLVCMLHSVAFAVLLPNIIFYAAVAKRLLPNINMFISSKISLKGFEYSWEIVAKEFRRSENKDKISIPEKQIHFQQQLEFKDVCFSYSPNKKQILKNINFVLNKNQSIGFVGYSGGGKTTLVELLTSLLSPDSGTILVDGVAVSNLKGLCLEIGYEPQLVTLLDDTIAKNIAFGQEEVDEEKVNQMIKMAHLEDFVFGLADGIHARIGERGIKISGGQRQRIGIARALYKDPSILIFDEATSSLDNVSEQKINEAIKDLGGKKTMIIVAHRLTSVKHVDKIYVLHEGQIYSSGTHDELMQKCEIYQKLNKSV